MPIFTHTPTTVERQLPPVAPRGHLAVPDRPCMFLAWKRARSTGWNGNSVTNSTAEQAFEQRAESQKGGGRIK